MEVMLEGSGGLMTGGVGIEELRALSPWVDLRPSLMAFILSWISSTGLGIIEELII